MHHYPAGPSPTARLAAFLRRRTALLSAGVVCTVVAAIVLTALVLTGTAGTPDGPGTVSASSGTTADEQSPAQTGAVGDPAAGSAAAATDSAAEPGGTTVDASTPSPSGTGTAGSTAPEATTPDASTPDATAPDAPAPDAPAPDAPAPDAPAPDASAPDAAPAPAAAAVAPASSGSVEAQVLALVNQARAAAGCGPVTADGGLAAVARAHSADMRDRAFFDHTNPGGQDPFDRAAAAGVSARAENIARGQSDAAAMMAAWMGSPGHRANILDCSLTRLGVGVAEGSGGPWWTQLLG